MWLFTANKNRIRERERDRQTQDSMKVLHSSVGLENGCKKWDGLKLWKKRWVKVPQHQEKRTKKDAKLKGSVVASDPLQWSCPQIDEDIKEIF